MSCKYMVNMVDHKEFKKFDIETILDFCGVIK